MSSVRWMEQKAPSVDFLLGRLARALFGGDLYAALHRLNDATDELMPIAPSAVLSTLEPIFDLIAGYGEGLDRPGARARWLEQLQLARQEFALELGQRAQTQPVWTRAWMTGRRDLTSRLALLNGEGR